MSAFNFAEFNEHFKGCTPQELRTHLVSMSRVAEAAERYEDMCQFMKELVNNSEGDLTVEERNLLSVAYKNVIGARRASWRTLCSETENKTAKLIEEYKDQLEKELDGICHDVLTLLEDKLIPDAQKPDADNQEEPLVFYLKMAADYYRYLAEALQGKDYDEKAIDYYRRAFEIAEKELLPTHPIRLGLALNYSVCLYEIRKEKKDACDLAKNAFDEAISKLDKLEESDYKDSTLIMQLLRDNLTLWTSSTEDPEDEQEN